jgi:hypothetical protein
LISALDISDDNFSISPSVHTGWATTWGDVESQVGRDTTAEDNGNIYLTGETKYAPARDAFVAKFDIDGNLLWDGVWGGAINDFGLGVELDSAGNVYVAGVFDGTCDFDSGIGMQKDMSAADADCFISKFNSSGVYQWAVCFGSTGVDQVKGIGVDPSGNVSTIGGFYYTVDFDPGPGVEERTAGTTLNDIFVLSLDSLSNYRWVDIYGTTIGRDEGYGVSVDNSGNVFATGYIFQANPSFQSRTISSTSAGLSWTRLIRSVLLGVGSIDQYLYPSIFT